MEDGRMLVLSRKPGEQVYIGDHITITVVEIKGNRIRLGITAPENVSVLRAELGEFMKSGETTLTFEKSV
jgi:carbon storage regulator